VERKRAIERKTREVEQLYAQSERQLQAVRACIQAMFLGLDCDPHSDLLGSQGVTEANLMTYLGLVEQRLNELLQLHALVRTAHEDDAHHPGPPVGLSHGPLRIEPPSFAEEASEDDFSEDDGNEKPMGLFDFQKRFESNKKPLK
jgi:hypothetical protein